MAEQSVSGGHRAGRHAAAEGDQTIQDPPFQAGKRRLEKQRRKRAENGRSGEDSAS